MNSGEVWKRQSTFVWNHLRKKNSIFHHFRKSISAFARMCLQSSLIIRLNHHLTSSFSLPWHHFHAGKIFGWGFLIWCFPNEWVVREVFLKGSKQLNTAITFSATWSVNKLTHTLLQWSHPCFFYFLNYFHWMHPWKRWRWRQCMKPRYRPDCWDKCVRKSCCINSSVIPILRRAYILSFALFWWSFVSSTDFHKAAPYVVTGSVDQTVKVWECRWFGPWRIGPPPQLPRRSSGSHLPSSCHPTSLFSSHLSPSPHLT